jgi:hypothetical protein
MAYMVTSGGAAGVASALAAVRKSTDICEYAIPKLDGAVADLNQINVQIRSGPAGPNSFQNLFYVRSAAGCSSDPVRNPAGQGWYYDNLTAAPKITLCANTCSQLKATDGSEINVLLGCAMRLPPPPN